MTSASIVAQLDQILEGTRPLLAALPDDSLGWRPHDRSWTLGELAAHIANIPSWTAGTLNASELDLAPVGGEPMPPVAPPKTTADLLAALDQSAAEARSVVEATSDETFLEPWSLLVAGDVRFTLPKGAVIRTFILDHLIHHRAQLGVYLRLLDVPVPQTMGPTADFPEM
ncbi:MAG: DinB family protein [Gemmatimonadetes bacterium]|nr:DinB family protein [Gemmatimonadota bacterium]MCY3944393.1 DinB family protein [Gemmatimonadota bacterium]